jgi:Xaa-Pro aminopeptidase
MSSQGENFVSASFSTIAGYGPNGAVIHYRATPETNAKISNDSLFLVDSGGLYW